MSAVWYRFRAELRGRWSATAGLIVLVGLVGGIALAAAGARRTATAYPRFLEESGAADVLVKPDLGVFTELDFDAVAALPEVADMATIAGLIVVPPGADGEPSFDDAPQALAPIDERGFATLERPIVVEGRLPDPNRADEALVNPALADQQSLSPGATLTLYTASIDELYAAEEAGTLPSFEETEVTVTGVAVDGDEIVTDEVYADDGRLVLTPAFYRDHVDSVGFWGLYVELAGDEADLASFRAGVERLAGDEAIEFKTSASTTATVQRAIRPQAVALVLFAAVAGLAGLLVSSQTLARQLGADAGDAPALNAVGMSRRQRLAVHLLRAAVVAAGGALVATLVAFGLSPLFPIGAARLAEPHPGPALDLLVVGEGAPAMAALLCAGVALPAWWLAGIRHPGTGAHAARDRPSRVGAAMVRAGMSPSAVTGVRMALEPGRGGSAVPTRSTLVGAALAVAYVLAALTFAASLDRLLDTPRLYGWDWDAMVLGGDGDDADIAAAVAARGTELGTTPR